MSESKREFNGAVELTVSLREQTSLMQKPLMGGTLKSSYPLHPVRHLANQ